MALLHRNAIAFVAALFACAAVSCSAPQNMKPVVAEPAAHVQASSATPSAPSPSESSRATATDGVAPVEATTVSVESKSEADAAIADYKPPFPDRVDLFVPPKREGGSTAGQNGNDNAVELMGFVRVDRQRAVLSINGEITQMAEGETQFGIEVISVHPPNVVLQRGRQRWQATLE